MTSYFICCFIVVHVGVQKHGVLLYVLNPISSCNYIIKFQLTFYEIIPEFKVCINIMVCIKVHDWYKRAMY
jgi:hypothetical protein